jgi:hypothetical protein
MLRTYCSNELQKTSWTRVIMSILCCPLAIWCVRGPYLSHLIQLGKHEPFHTTLHFVNISYIHPIFNDFLYINDSIVINNQEVRTIQGLGKVDLFEFSINDHSVLMGAFSRIYLQHTDNTWINMFSLGLLAPRCAHITLVFKDNLYNDTKLVKQLVNTLFGSIGWNMLFSRSRHDWVSYFVLFNALACVIGTMALFRFLTTLIKKHLSKDQYARQQKLFTMHQRVVDEILRNEFDNDVYISNTSKILSNYGDNGSNNDEFLNSNSILAQEDEMNTIPLSNASPDIEYQQKQEVLVLARNQIIERQKKLMQWISNDNSFHIFAIVDQCCSISDIENHHRYYMKFVCLSTISNWTILLFSLLWTLPFLELTKESYFGKIAIDFGTTYLIAGLFAMFAHIALDHEHGIFNIPIKRFRRAFSSFLFPICMFASLTYTVHLALWFCLGIILKPEVCIPIIVNVVLIVTYVISTFQKLRAARTQMLQHIRWKRYSNECADFHTHGDEVKLTISTTKIIITILGGVAFLVCTMVFMVLGFFAFSTAKINSVYYTLVLSIGPTLTALATKLFNIKSIIDDKTPQHIRYSEKFREFLRTEEENLPNLCDQHIRF